MSFGESQFEKPPTPSAEKSERMGIEAIENSSLGPQDKEDLLLVYLGEKPAARISAERRFYKTEVKKEELESLGRKTEEVKKVLEGLGLPSHIFRHETEEEKTILISHDFLVGQDQEKLNRLKEALKNGPVEDIGFALGYPKSAVEGFVKGEIIDRYKDLKKLSKKERDELKREGVFNFLTFGLSKSNWREELELVRRYQKVIKDKSPKLYDEIIRESAVNPFTFRSRLGMTLGRVLNKIEFYKRGFRKEKA